MINDSAARDTVTGAVALDAPSAVEFMREALIKISEDEIGAIASELNIKAQRMQLRLTPDALDARRTETVPWILRHVFATKRRARQIVDSVGIDFLADSVSQLVHGQKPVGERFQAFDERLAAVEAPVRRELGGECLRFADPDRYWLWSRWMWDPAADTGSLPLVLVTGYDLEGPDAGVIYCKVGDAISAVVDTAEQIGFHRMKASRFAVDVYLAAIYGVYVYTVTRMRMTQEFTKVIPELPELVRRLLGVHRMDA